MVSACMVLVYSYTFTTIYHKKPAIHVGKYTTPMDPSWDCNSYEQKQALKLGETESFQRILWVQDCT